MKTKIKPITIRQLLIANLPLHLHAWLLRERIFKKFINNILRDIYLYGDPSYLGIITRKDYRIHNTAENDVQLPIYDKYLFESAFNWADTEEGYSYWYRKKDEFFNWLDNKQQSLWN